MRQDEIIEILNDWNFWRKELDTGKERAHYIARAEAYMGSNMVLTITGARRSGKSYIMRQLARRVAERDGARNTLIVNLEDSRFAELDLPLLDAIFEAYLENLKPDMVPSVFIDEAQRVSGWERWVRTAHELRRAKIAVSGSTASIIGRDLATLMTGRHLDLTVFPLSFAEFLRFKGIEVEDRVDFASRRVEIRGMLKEYLEYGGFPEVVLSKPEVKKEILRGYFEDMTEKDIVIRHRVRNVAALRALAGFYMTNVSSPTTSNSLEKFLKADAGTIDRFSSYLEDAFVVFFVRRFAHSVKPQEKSPKKVYAIDTGLCNAVGFRTGENRGKLIENAVAVELRRRVAEDPSCGMYYWKGTDGKEVDFVIAEGASASQAIQVCWDVSSPETRRREVRALIRCMDELSLKEGMVITEDYEGEEDVDGKRIAYIAVGKWLLGL